jgi:hypothetical protein
MEPGIIPNIRDNKMKSTFPGLFIGCWFFIFGVAFVQGEEALVARCMGSYFILKDSSGEPIQIKLADNVADFEITQSGHFIMADDRTHSWFKGRVDSSLIVKKQFLRSAPGIKSNSQIAISEDGKRVAWANYGPNKSDLIIEEYSENQPTVMCRLTIDGLILAPSWSPDGRLLAFFAGPPEALVRDGFSLMLLDMNSANNHPVSIAPPSLPTRLTPARSTLSWTPDGKFIQFEANYEDKFSPNLTYLVSVDGRRMILFNSHGTWNKDGKHLYVIKGKGKSPTIPDEHVAAEVEIFQNDKERPILDLKIPGGILESFQISPSAKKVAYIQNKVFVGVPPTAQGPIASMGRSYKNNMIFIYDSIAKMEISFGPDHFSNFFWIVPEKTDEAGQRSPTASLKPAKTMKISFAEKKYKNKRLFDIVNKICAKEIERNHINVSVEEAKIITRYFLFDEGYDESYSLPPDDSFWKLCKSLEDVRINGKDKEEAYQRYIGTSSSKELWEENWLNKYKTAEDVRQLRARIATNFDELIDVRYPSYQTRVKSWLLFRKASRAVPSEESYLDKLLDRERNWWKSRLGSYRKIIDSDITDQEILAVITNKLDLSANKENFLRNYFEKKTR